MNLTDMIDSVELEHEASGRWGLSVACLAGRSVEEIVARQFNRAPLRHPKIRVSTVGAIRAAGADVVRSGQPPHALVLFDHEPTTEDWATLVAAFAPAEPNPGLAGQ